MHTSHSSIRRAVSVMAALSLLATMLALTAGPAAATPPGVNGKIAFERAAFGGTQTFTMDPDGSNQAPLTQATATSSPAWSPGGASIALMAREGTGPRGLYVADADGSNLTRLTRETASICCQSIWSPDGSYILLAGYVFDATTGADVARLAGDYGTQPWSPDGAELAVTSWTSSSTEVFVFPLDGSAPTKLTDTPGRYEHAPAWSPDGTRIAYHAYGDQKDIWVMDADGGNPMNLTDDVAEDFYPLWSPDGSRLLFTSNRDSGTWRHDLFVMQADGTGIVNLTNGPIELGPRAWSPDGTMVAFSADLMDGEGWGLFVVGADGTGMARLATTQMSSAVSWQPRNAPEPVADGPFVMDEGATLDVAATGLLANDIDPNGDALTVGSHTDPEHGTLTVYDDGGFTYVHDGSETTTDAFTYWAFDGTWESLETKVAITIAPVNDAPVAGDDGPYLVAKGGTLTINGVLDNDTDAEGDALTAVLETPPAHGSLTLAANGSFLYVHDGSAAGTDEFTYRAHDGVAGSAVATARLAIHSVPPAPPPAELTADGVGLVDPDSGWWYLRGGDGTISQFLYGNPGDYPMLGDWDCDGVETPGLYRQSDGYVYLRNSNSVGIADLRFYFGNPGDVPLAGDFDGDGCDTVSLYRPSESRVYVINALGAAARGIGAADHVYTFGNPGDKPFVGDFNGDGVDSVGLHRESTGLVYLRNAQSPGPADRTFVFGDPGDRMVCGTWTGSGAETIGVFRPDEARFYLKVSHVPGTDPLEFGLGEADWMPVAGYTGM